MAAAGRSPLGVGHCGVTAPCEKISIARIEGAIARKCFEMLRRRCADVAGRGRAGGRAIAGEGLPAPAFRPWLSVRACGTGAWGAGGAGSRGRLQVLPQSIDNR